MIKRKLFRSKLLSCGVITAILLYFNYLIFIKADDNQNSNRTYKEVSESSSDFKHKRVILEGRTKNSPRARLDTKGGRLHGLPSDLEYDRRTVECRPGDTNTSRIEIFTNNSGYQYFCYRFYRRNYYSEGGGRLFTAKKPLKVSSDTLERTSFPLTNFVDINNQSILDGFQFVSGISSNHFHELLAIESVQKHFPAKTLILYDLGLTEDNLGILRRFPHVHVRRLNFTKYPPHVHNLHTYSFKGIIMHEILQEFPGALWIDSSINLTTGNLIKVFDTVRRTSGVSAFFKISHTVFAATHPDMYEYFGIDSPATDRSLAQYCFQSGLVLVYRTEFVYQNIMRWHFLCSLDEDCIAPAGHQQKCRGVTIENKYFNCHRYDQSLYNILFGNALYAEGGGIRYVHGPIGKISRMNPPKVA